MDHPNQQQNQNPRMGTKEEELIQTRSDLEQREKEKESLKPRMGKKEDDLNQTRSDLEQREKEKESLKPRFGLKRREKQVKSLHQSMGKMKEELFQKRSDLKRREKQVKSLHQRMGKKEEELNQTRSDLEQREEKVKSLQQRMREMEEELNQKRSALDAKDEELKSFKDRVAADVSLSMKTASRLESMNSPISTSRLEDMYEELRSQWPKIKTDLKSIKETPETVKRRIQIKFNKAKLAMEMKKVEIDEVFELDEASRGSASEKVQQCWQSTCQNLQLVLYHGRKEDADLKTPSSPCEGGKPQDVKESLFSKCYWLGCLMALNNPPLQPDWNNHDSGMDKWNFFPQKLTDASGK